MKRLTAALVAFWVMACAHHIVHPRLRPLDASLHFRTTAEMPGDARVKTDLDRLAQGELEIGGVGIAGMIGDDERLFFSIARRLSPTERLELLAHESPVVRGYAMVFIAYRQRDDIDAIEPLLGDQSTVFELNGCMGTTETIADLTRRLLGGK